MTGGRGSQVTEILGKHPQTENKQSGQPKCSSLPKGFSKLVPFYCSDEQDFMSLSSFVSLIDEVQ